MFYERFIITICTNSYEDISLLFKTFIFKKIVNFVFHLQPIIFGRVIVNFGIKTWLALPYQGVPFNGVTCIPGFVIVFGSVPRRFLPFLKPGFEAGIKHHHLIFGSVPAVSCSGRLFCCLLPGSACREDNNDSDDK